MLRAIRSGIQNSANTEAEIAPKWGSAEDPIGTSL